MYKICQLLFFNTYIKVYIKLKAESIDMQNITPVTTPHLLPLHRTLNLLDYRLVPVSRKQISNHTNKQLI